jgi:hypothetical protein
MSPYFNCNATTVVVLSMVVDPINDFADPDPEGKKRR